LYSGNTILTVYLAPKDQYSYENFKLWHRDTKRRWRSAQVEGAEEIKILENNRRHKARYTRPLKIFGWLSDNVKYEKQESNYQDLIGDVYYDYYKKFVGYVLDWWGVGGKFTKKTKKDRNTKSVPNTPMLDVSIHFDNNSFMDKIYMQGMDYDTAVGKTFKGRAQSAELLRELKEFNMVHEGMNEEEANEEAIRVAEMVQRNLALDKNSPTDNEYGFMINYFNKFIDSKLREMMKVNMNIWFLKELMKSNPNMGFYVLGPYNRLMRVQGVVGKRGDNVVVAMEQVAHSKKYKYEYVYSVDKDTKFFVNEKGFIPAKDLTMQKSKLKNMLWGNRPTRVEHRYNTEFFYDLVLEGKTTDGVFPWFDAHHNVFVAPDYSNPNNLIGKDIIV
jgi:hypothetical protein